MPCGTSHVTPLVSDLKEFRTTYCFQLDKQFHSRKSPYIPFCLSLDNKTSGQARLNASDISVSKDHASTMIIEGLTDMVIAINDL